MRCVGDRIVYCTLEGDTSPVVRYRVHGAEAHDLEVSTPDGWVSVSSSPELRVGYTMARVRFPCARSTLDASLRDLEWRASYFDEGDELSGLMNQPDSAYVRGLFVKLLLGL